jgi:hypothetical protein
MVQQGANQFVQSFERAASHRFDSLLALLDLDKSLPEQFRGTSAQGIYQYDRHAAINRLGQDLCRPAATQRRLAVPDPDQKIALGNHHTACTLIGNWPGGSSIANARQFEDTPGSCEKAGIAVCQARIFEIGSVGIAVKWKNSVQRPAQSKSGIGGDGIRAVREVRNKAARSAVGTCNQFANSPEDIADLHNQGRHVG